MSTPRRTVTWPGAAMCKCGHFSSSHGGNGIIRCRLCPCVAFKQKVNNNASCFRCMHPRGFHEPDCRMAVAPGRPCQCESFAERMEDIKSTPACQCGHTIGVHGQGGGCLKCDCGQFQTTRNVPIGAKGICRCGHVDTAHGMPACFFCNCIGYQEWFAITQPKEPSEATSNVRQVNPIPTPVDSLRNAMADVERIARTEGTGVPVAILRKAIALIDTARLERDAAVEVAKAKTATVSSRTKSKLDECAKSMLMAVEALDQVSAPDAMAIGRKNRARMLMLNAIEEIKKESK